MAYDVFISYSSADKAEADAVCSTLESRGIVCWIAPRDVLPGEEYAAALVRALHDSRLMILLFSSHANQSPQVLREVERAVSKGLTIVPLRIENVPPTAAMEYYISSCQWLDALTPPFEQHLGVLTQTVVQLLGRAGRAVGGTPPVPVVATKTTRSFSPRLAAAAAVLIIAVVLGVLFAASRSATRAVAPPVRPAAAQPGTADSQTTGTPEPTPPASSPPPSAASGAPAPSPGLTTTPSSSAGPTTKADAQKGTPHKPSECTRLLERVSLGEEDLLTPAEKAILKQCGT